MSSSSSATPSAQHNFIDQSIKSKFQIITKIGSGAYGHVWKVRDRSTSQILAIKKVFLAFQNQIDAQRVYRQIALLKKLKHSNIVGLKKILPAQNGQDIYLLFDFMESDVFKAVKNRVLDLMHKKYIVYQLACGLKYLHSAGVLHRDLKPSNILINAQCQVKICDFGLSRTLESAFFNKAIMTEFIATRWYRAPQVLLGSRSYSTKSDMWSLGCLIYQLYSRRTLLPGENTIDQITKIVEFRGKPTPEEIASFKTQKANQILSYFKVQQKPLQFFYDDLQIQEIKPLLDSLIQYNPDKRLSAQQLLDSPFLSQFRDKSCEVLAQSATHLGLNDNRRYKVERYKEQIIKLGMQCPENKPSSSKRLFFSNRSSKNSYSKLSLHNHDLSQNLKSSNSKINTSLRQKFKESKSKHQSGTNSPQSRHQVSLKGSSGSGFSLHVERKNVLNLNQNQKGISLHNKRSIYLNQPKKVSKECMQKKKSIPKRSLHHQSSSCSKQKISRDRHHDISAKNKQNYEDRLKTLKKTQFRHYRNQIKTQHL